jgi:hypothetical protein
MFSQASRPSPQDQTPHDREVGSRHASAPREDGWDRASIETLARFAMRRNISRAEANPSGSNGGNGGNGGTASRGKSPRSQASRFARLGD